MIRAPVKHRLGDRSTRPLVANPRRRRGGSLRGHFSGFADRAAQGRPDPTSPPRRDGAQTSGALRPCGERGGAAAPCEESKSRTRGVSRNASGAIPRGAFGPCDPPGLESPPARSRAPDDRRSRQLLGAAAAGGHERRARSRRAQRAAAPPRSSQGSWARTRARPTPRTLVS